LSNPCEGGGEIGEKEEPRSPQVIIQPRTLSTPDKGSSIKFLQEEARETEELRSFQVVIQQGMIIILD